LSERKRGRLRVALAKQVLGVGGRGKCRPIGGNRKPIKTRRKLIEKSRGGGYRRTLGRKRREEDADEKNSLFQSTLSVSVSGAEVQVRQPIRKKGTLK